MPRITIGPVNWKIPSSSALGASASGGFLICKAGGIGWIVAPNTTEVSRTWYCRNDAVTTAQANAACGDWFVPSVGQLQNPGYVCRTYWDSYSARPYWSSTEFSAYGAYYVRFGNGSATRGFKDYARCVRAFRCVTY